MADEVIRTSTEQLPIGLRTLLSKIEGPELIVDISIPERIFTRAILPDLTEASGMTINEDGEQCRGYSLKCRPVDAVFWRSHPDRVHIKFHPLIAQLDWIYQVLLNGIDCFQFGQITATWTLTPVCPEQGEAVLAWLITHSAMWGCPQKLSISREHDGPAVRWSTEDPASAVKEVCYGPVGTGNIHSVQLDVQLRLSFLNDGDPEQEDAPLNREFTLENFVKFLNVNPEARTAPGKNLNAAELFFLGRLEETDTDDSEDSPTG